ncbi:hypothetical protein HPT27_15020 [Permianibacter sp. IMCC34836]|uniref:hypothetical protein n=1 Tax=Permianibacter fluminis TaxID=2738515 RepID=UPI0015540F84|nr:hypothetical protein [Permianibacter fluminis]NQD38337.1 hypothetical protein [Permianibacter fluminis]
MKHLMLSLAGAIFLLASPVFAADATNKPVAAADKKAADKMSVDKNTAKPADRSALGMSVTGTQEAPKVLYIVPWKTLDAVPAEPYVSGLMDEVFSPVDPVVFERGVQQFEQRQQADSAAAAATK